MAVVASSAAAGVAWVSRDFALQRLQPAALHGIAARSPAQPPQGLALDFSDYPTSAAVVAFCHQLAAAYPHLVQVVELGASYLGRPILALEVGSRLGSDPAQRPALQMDGQHHAREPIGQQAVLYTVWHLVSSYGSDPLATHLLDTRTLYAVPCVNPDGNDFFLESYYPQRKNLRPLDDDGDGPADEDWPAGVSTWDVYQVYEVRLSRTWLAAHRNNPFEQGWRNAARSRYLGYYNEVRGDFLVHADPDGDGKSLEDQPGGVDLNRNYPVGWEKCNPALRSNLYRGEAPFSEPETQALRTLIEGRPNIRLAVSYHSGDDRLAIPGVDEGPGADAGLLELVGIKASQLTEASGYRGTPHQHGTPVASGETRAWLYEQGILAWLVEAYLDEGPVKYRWVDREQGILRAYEHIGLRFNPPPTGILDVCRRWLDLNLYLLAAVPCPRPCPPLLDGSTLSLGIHNDGFVSVGVRCEVAVGGGPPVFARRLEGGPCEPGMCSGSGELGAASGNPGWMLRIQMDPPSIQALAEREDLTVTLRVDGASREHPGPPLVASSCWRLDPKSGSFVLADRDAAGAAGGAGQPPGELFDLGAAFGEGGWFADPAVWDREVYHMGRIPRPREVVP